MSSSGPTTKQRRTPSLHWIGIACICVYIVFTVGRAGEAIPGLGGVPIAKILLLVLVIALISQWRALATLDPAASRIARTIGWLVGVTIFSVAVSVYKSNSLKLLLEVVPALVLGSYFILRVSATWENVRRLIMSFIVSALLLSIVTILSFGGGRAEAGGTSYDPNDLAYLLVTAIPVCIGLYRSGSGLTAKIMVAAAMVMAITVLLTASRGGLVGLAVGATSYFLMSMHGNPRRPGFLKIFFLAVLLVIGGIVVWSNLPSETRERLDMFSLEDDYNMAKGNKTGRTDIWLRSLESAAARPIGYGIGSFVAVDGSTGGAYYTAHNSYVLVVVELGFLGLFLYLRTLFLLFRELGRTKSLAVAHRAKAKHSKLPDLAPVADGLRAGLLANCVAGFFLSMSYSAILWTFIVIGVGFVSVSRTLASRID